MRVIEASSDDPSSEPTLLDRARGGERRALETLLLEQYPLVYGVCRRLMGNDADALDAAQEALVAIVRGVGRFDGRSRFTTWVYRVAVNASIDELRRRARRPIPTPESLFEEATESEDATVTRIDVDTALMQLAVDFRAAVVLRDICGLDYQEIAAVLDIPGGTVRSRIARGRALLVGFLDPESSRQ
jgi:RNA polymerase sigma-70 factor, ECF subfamily